MKKLIWLIIIIAVVYGVWTLMNKPAAEAPATTTTTEEAAPVDVAAPVEAAPAGTVAQ